MKVLKKFEFPVSTFGQSTHDWNAIFAAKVAHDALGKPGPAVELVEGTDYTGKPELFQSSIRTNATKRHLNVKCPVVKVEGKPTCIFVQVSDMNDEEIANADARIENAKEKNKAHAAKRKATAQVAGTVPAATQAS